MKLKRKDLLKFGHYIDGKWQDSEQEYAVKNPANGNVLGHVAKAGVRETELAIEAAEKAFKSWKKLTAKERSKAVHRWGELMMENQEDLAIILTSEQGKPYAEAKGEVAYAASFLEWFAAEGKRIYGDIIPTHKPDARILVTKEAIGVVGAITPWNFPLAMITRKAGPAIAVGCTMVLKPSEETPLSALALAVLAEKAGIPKGVFNVISGDAPAIGKVMTSSPAIRKISFTGSTRVGKLLMQQSAETMKKMSLELGGNAPFIVFDDADLEAAVQGAMASKYRNTGQTCVCANRLYVQSGIYEAFTTKLAQAVRGLKVGEGFEEGVTQGPLINEMALKKVESHVQDAIMKGGKILTGGKASELGGTFYQPTLITEATSAMLFAHEETFGPVAACQRFETEADVIAMANDTVYGLSAYFYARDIGRVWRVAEGLEAGIIGINEGIISTESAPFGGVKESGLGREGSKYGADDYVETKYILMGGIA